MKGFAADQGLEYAEFGFVNGNMEVLGVLREVADQARIVAMVAREEVKEKEVRMAARLGEGPPLVAEKQRS